jgi:hypothetical protein
MAEGNEAQSAKRSVASQNKNVKFFDAKLRLTLLASLLFGKIVLFFLLINKIILLTFLLTNFSLKKLNIVFLQIEKLRPEILSLAYIREEKRVEALSF